MRQHTEHYLIKLCYDGTRYHGWQVQPDGNTIQNKLNQSLELILQSNIKSIGGSRTDSGVHALSQFVKIELKPKISPEQLQKALNGVLPLDIRVLSIRKCEALSLIHI